jgi:alkylation response protein AidB-like acyl-CoA dehydrogenase
MIKEKIAKMATRLMAAESMMYRTAGLLEGRLKGLDMDSEEAGIRTAEALEEYLVECSINKVYGSETEDYVVDEEVQIHGGYGYIRGNHPELAYRNARINRIWEGTNEINRLVILNTLLRRLQGSFDLGRAFDSIWQEMEKMESPDSDIPQRLTAQEALIRIAKKVFLLVLGAAYESQGSKLRTEQELVRAISDMVIEIYAMESALLRARKIQQGKHPEKVEIPTKMTKVLFYESVERVAFTAREALDTVDQGDSLKRHLHTIRGLMASPPIDVIRLRRDIADAMLRAGRYAI